MTTTSEPERSRASGAGDWPASVFEAAVLRGIEPRARKELSAAGRLISLKGDQTLYREGDPEQAFYVVANGEISLRATRRGDDHETEIRCARAGDSFGEEAITGMPRRARAVAVGKAIVAEIPVHMFRRVAERSGRAEVAERTERMLRRAATRDLLRTLAFTRSLSEQSFDALLDTVTLHSVARGESVYHQGDKADALWLVASGLVQLQLLDEDDRLHVRAYLSRGDFFGDTELTTNSRRTSGAVASGPSHLVRIPADVVRGLGASLPDLLSSVGRVTADQLSKQTEVIGAAAKHHTQHAFHDLYRMKIAQSLLVIDLDTCVRCGHCAWACADLYGTARLVRRGDKMVARVDESHAEPQAPRTLLVPNSCQHCENPACMVDCPTGAIGRDPRGEVFIRPELCTGCGACAKACPWENIHMALRPEGMARPVDVPAEDIAVKCDLCREYDNRPACVQACPTGSIFRMQPSEELIDVRKLLGPRRDGRTRHPRDVSPGLRSFVLPATGAAIAAISVGVLGVRMHGGGYWRAADGIGYGAGWLSALLFFALLAYAVPKRWIRLRMHRTTTASTSETEGAHNRVQSAQRPQLRVHIVVGMLSLGIALCHTPNELRLDSFGGILAMAFWLAGLSGLWTAIMYISVPRSLARLERAAALPEDLRSARRELLDRLYREVSGRSDLVKKIFEKLLLPYATRRSGAVLLVVSGRTLKQEEAAVRARVDGILEGRGQERLAGLDTLIRIVVELRALPAQRVLLTALRVGLPVHIVAFALALPLLFLHIVGVF